MSDTKQRILDTMLELIQTRGYSAVSYRDIADQLQIRKASIHYHFPSKAELGVAVVEHYQEMFLALLAAAEEAGKRPAQMLDVYLTPFRVFAKTPDKICLCGALAGEFLALPKSMQVEVTKFFELQQNILEKLLSAGKKRGDFVIISSPRKQAQFIFSALQGALLVMRSNGEKRQLDNVISEIRARLLPM